MSLIRDVLLAMGWLSLFAWFIGVLGLLSGCTVGWMRLPDDPQGQRVYRVTIGFGVGTP